MLLNRIRVCCVLMIVMIAIEETKANAKILEYFQQPGQHLHLNRNRKTTANRVHDLGYPCEQHEVQTEDGYYITVFRIPYSPKNSTKSSGTHRPKVLLQHGLLGTSDSWILNGPDDGLPFLLADRGYDVWLGNSRGNLYGRKHKNLTVSDGEFWRFSWHEIGYYDLASMMDYVLQHETNPAHQSLHYIGHSQGTTVLMVLLSLRPEYQQQLRTVNLMAPVIILDHSEDRLLQVLSSYLGYHNIITERFSRQEFVPFNELFNLLSYSVCNKDSIFQAFCSPMAFMIEGSFTNKNVSALHLCLESHPGGISTEQLLHFMQIHYSSSFRQYDFGFFENQLRYNQAEPPVYPLENISKMLHVWYGEADQTVSPVDVQRFTERLAAVRLYRVSDDLWSHGDYLFSLNVRQYINEPIIEILNKYECNKV